MAKFKRPIPQRQNDLLRKNLEAPSSFTSPGETSENFPSDGLVPSNLPPSKKEEINRGQITRRDDDTINDVAIGLQDHDEAIQYYMDNIIKPEVVMNGERIPVPLMYGNPERWQSAQQRGAIRDRNGKLQLPLIMFKRNEVSRRRDLGKKMDANNPQLHYTFQKQYTNRNQYDNFSVLQGREPQKEYFAVAVPDYVLIKYSFIIWTDYVAQMNKLVEAINYTSDSYWGDPERFKFNARIDSFANKVEVAQGKDRMVKTDFGLTLQGYIVPDAMNANIHSHPKKFYNKSIVKFNTNVVSSFGKVDTDRESTRNQNPQNTNNTPSEYQ
jgi:hypothetical protein